MKKQLLKFTFVTVVAVLCGQMAWATWEEDRVLTDPLVMQQGTEADWVVCIENTNPLQAFQFDFALPEGVEVALKANGKYNISLDPERIEDVNFTVVSNYLEDLGVYRVAAYSPEGDVFNEINNRMLTIKLASINEEVGNFEILINNIEFTENKIAIHPEDTTASLTIFNPAVSIILDPTNISFKAGETAAFPTYTLDPTNSAFGTTVSWNISETDCVAIDEDGNLKGLAPTKSPVIITFTATNDYTDEAITAECTIEVVSEPKQEQVITWVQPETTIEIGDEITLTAESTSGLEIDYQIIEGIGLAEIINDILFSYGVGDVIVRAIQPGNEYYSAAIPVELTFSIVKCTQEINLENSTIKMTEGDQIMIEASATSGLPITLSIIDGADCVTLDGNLLTAVTMGSAIIEVSQAGNTQYEAANPAYINVTIEPLSDLGSVSLNYPKVLVSDGHILVWGADDHIIEVFTPAGLLVYRGTDTNISVPTQSIYIVRIGKSVTKISVR